MFKIGQKVKCLNGSFAYNCLDWATHFPVKGDIYTIRAIRQQPHYLDRTMGLAVWLEEIVNPLLLDGMEPSFSAWRFRALSDDKCSAKDRSDSRCQASEEITLSPSGASDPKGVYQYQER